MHGHRHLLHAAIGGLNHVNPRSEFVGYHLPEQRLKIQKGLEILKSHCIYPKIFVAPCHTFDTNTLEALCAESDIHVISDTIADDIYYQYGFYFIPQQCGMVRALKNKITTFCYHPNFTSDNDFTRLENFLKSHKKQFISYKNISLKKENYLYVIRFFSYCIYAD